ncbi:hypothetical protein L0B53_18950 (plasmid) [Vibrio sp. SS-MA-C1-2]|uniref:hypothetical protein n=1 Tax=Vibrio sp. SS-MA-C1-2 TaxID=2908646 RepID=UPI001F47048E|nr:hypothetical protein [Vibrio sp. SS-MA-C1-2]UJF20215.1 hypothetical protein L0B53_18950 [Vibrio sp. SS-MA-C1-2]
MRVNINLFLKRKVFPVAKKLNISDNIDTVIEDIHASMDTDLSPKQAMVLFCVKNHIPVPYQLYRSWSKGTKSVFDLVSQTLSINSLNSFITSKKHHFQNAVYFMDTRKLANDLNLDNCLDYSASLQQVLESKRLVIYLCGRRIYIDEFGNTSKPNLNSLYHPSDSSPLILTDSLFFMAYVLLRTFM